MRSEFYSNGKLLLTGEYAVLDGATALAVPTVYGQLLQITKKNSNTLAWKSLDADKTCWFEALFALPSLEPISYSNRAMADTLTHILKTTRKFNNGFLATETGLQVETVLDFPKNWGLGTSSTLINNIANWASINPYALLAHTFGGSGYDIACAQNDTPILYTLKGEQANVETVSFYPAFADNIYFIYLNRKQNSRDAISTYRKQHFSAVSLSQHISELTNAIHSATDLSAFETLIGQHEQLLSEVLKMDTVKEKYFTDYFGAVKSLGGWGGDFIMATGNEKTPGYFKAKGFDIVIPFKDMVLNKK